MTSVDPASYRNRGGLLQKAVSRYKVVRYFSRAGDGNVIKWNADFHITANAVLEIGTDCTIQNYAYFQLTMPRPRVFIGDNTVIG